MPKISRDSVESLDIPWISLKRIRQHNCMWTFWPRAQ